MDTSFLNSRYLTPNRAAIEELEAGKGQKFANVEALMDDLHADEDGCLDAAKGFGCI